MPRYYMTGVYGPDETVWHSDDDCPVLARVPTEDRIEGPQEGRDKCETCERMHQAKVSKMKFYNPELTPSPSPRRLQDGNQPSGNSTKPYGIHSG